MVRLTSGIVYCTGVHYSSPPIALLLLPLLLLL